MQQATAGQGVVELAVGHVTADGSLQLVEVLQLVH